MTIYALSRFQTPIYGSKKTHMSFTNPYRSRFQTPIYDFKKTPIYGSNVTITVSLGHMIAVLKHAYMKVWKHTY